MDDAVRGGGRTAQTVEVVEGAAVHAGPGRRDRPGGLLGPDHAGDLVARVEQVPDDGGTDEPGRAGDEYTHESALLGTKRMGGRLQRPAGRRPASKA